MVDNLWEALGLEEPESVRATLAWATGWEYEQPHSMYAEVERLDFDRGVCVIVRGAVTREMYRPLRRLAIKVIATWVPHKDAIAPFAARFNQDPDTPRVYFLYVGCEDFIIMLCSALKDNYIVIRAHDASFAATFAHISRCIFAASRRYDERFKERLAIKKLV